jgi:drug/metabolite transporter (DMT)-like permease
VTAALEGELARAAVWPLFFATAVYGHVAFKVAATRSDAAFSFWGTLLSAWGITAALAWAASAVLWICILARHPLLTANTVSSLSYVLIALAAVVLFDEPLTVEKVLGGILVVVGVWLVTR